MSNARNLADLLGTSTKSNQVISTSGAITTTGAFTSQGIDDNADANAITITSAEAVGIGTSLTPNNYSGYQVVTIGGSNATTGSALDLEDSDGNIEGYLSATAGRVYLEADPYAGNATSFMHLGVDGNQVLKLDDSRNVTITNGNLVIGTSGKGIDFSATSDGSGANQAEILDDYEEGTWTPTLTSGGTISTLHAAVYTKIGNIIRVGTYMALSNIPNNSSAFYIAGLPFNVSYTAGGANDHYHGAGSVTYVGSHDVLGFGMLPPTPYTGQASMYFHRGDGSSATVRNSDVTGMSHIIVATSYMTA